MKTSEVFATFASLFLSWLSAQGQTVFQDLNFEAADLSHPAGMYNEVPIANALPGWSGSIGADEVTSVWADGDSAGMAAISVEGPSTNAGGIGPLEGNYSVYLQSGFDPQTESVGVNVSLFQTGMIPSNAKSLEFSAWGNYPNFAVSFADTSLSPVILSSAQSPSGQTYEVYGASIAAYAGQTGELDFTALFNNGINYGDIELDDITFSTAAVTPEPNTLALVVMGGLALAARRWRKMDL